jgi:enoyl-CoA hydratase/carnithine racemase
MTDPDVRVDRDGPVATVTLCRPRVLNAQTPQMWARLRAVGQELDGGVRIVVVRGQGRAFSAGLDLSVAGGAPAAGGGGSEAGPAAGESMSLARIAALPDEEASRLIAGFQEAFDWLRRPDLISIAAVRGHAIGAGFQLALACDLRVCAEDAKFSMAEVTLGLVPDLGGTKRLVELVGYSRALELCVTGRRVAAAEAERIGLATSVVPGDDLDKAVADLTAQILAHRRDAVIEIKALMAAAASRGFPEQERYEREAQVRRIRDLIGSGE